MTQIKEVIRSLESLAPKSYAESYDNPGLIVGNSDAEVTAILLSLDCIEAVVDEAIHKGCNLIVSHHPIVFKGLKKLTGANYVERTVIKAIQNGIALYAIHTNLDSVLDGVNGRLASKIGLQQLRILQPKQDALSVLTFFVPNEHAVAVRQALFDAGAGQIGNYSGCSFSLEGNGTFTPVGGANPFTGKLGQAEQASETRIELMFPRYLDRQMLDVLRAAHPYEEMAYYLHHIVNVNTYVGHGMCGELPEPLAPLDFLALLKAKLGLNTVRYTTFGAQKRISRVAICGGSGSFLLPDAKAVGADAFVTGDFKYHEFFDAEGQILIADIGHYESERFTIDLLTEYISKKFSTFATHLTEVNTNPVLYYH
jgi:dinuclear metal center YbgI/SA1388 family protein